MKLKHFLFALLVTVVQCSFADSGGGSLTCRINCMDPGLNLFYYSIDGVVPVMNKKGKMEDYDMTKNIAIYDFNTKKISYLFPADFKDGITDFYFESHYDAQSKRIMLNGETDYQPNNIVGNINLKERTPCGKLIIVTWSFETKRSTIWTADKDGKNLKKICDHDEKDAFDLDIKNQVLRFYYQKEKMIEVKDVPYCE